MSRLSGLKLAPLLSKFQDCVLWTQDRRLTQGSGKYTAWKGNPGCALRHEDSVCSASFLLSQVHARLRLIGGAQQRFPEVLSLPYLQRLQRLPVSSSLRIEAEPLDMPPLQPRGALSCVTCSAHSFHGSIAGGKKEGGEDTW